MVCFVGDCLDLGFNSVVLCMLYFCFLICVSFVWLFGIGVLLFGGVCVLVFVWWIAGFVFCVCF